MSNSNFATSKNIVILNTDKFWESTLITTSTKNNPQFRDHKFVCVALDAATEVYRYLFGGCIMFPGLGTVEKGAEYCATFNYKDRAYVLDLYTLFDIEKDGLEGKTGLEFIQSIDQDKVNKLRDTAHAIGMIKSNLII